MATYNTTSPANTHGNLSHEQHTRNGTPYTNTTKANYMEWKRDIDRRLALHPDKLLSVVRDGTIDITRVIPLTHQLKAAGIDFAERRDELITSYSEVAYYEIIATLRCPTTLKTLEREFGANRDGRGAYAHIVDTWKSGTSSTLVALVDLDEQRTDLIRAGAKSASRVHMTEFVEALLWFNDELPGTDYNFLVRQDPHQPHAERTR